MLLAAHAGLAHLQLVMPYKSNSFSISAALQLFAGRLEHAHGVLPRPLHFVAT